MTTTDEAVFRRFGGLVLGLHYLEHLASDLPTFRIPGWAPVTLQQARTGASSLDEWQQARLAGLQGKSVIAKSSGFEESFSPFMVRGGNSSSLGSDPFIYSDYSDFEGLAHTTGGIAAGATSIVLQEMADHTATFGFATIHAATNLVTIELETPADVVLVDCLLEPAPKLRIETRSGRPLDEGLTHLMTRVAHDHRELARRITYGINTEGFLTAEGLTAIQLRPLPNDTHRDHQVAPLVEMAKQRRGAYVTRFVYNSCVYLGREDLPVDLLTYTAKPEKGVAREYLRSLRGGDALLRSFVRSVEASSRPAVWASEDYIRTIQAGRRCLVLDATDAFHLCHSMACLPPAGLLRRAYRYISCHSEPALLHDLGRLEIYSDGWYGVICGKQ